MTGPSGDAQVQILRRIYADIPELTVEYQKNGVTPLLIATGYPVAFFSVKPLQSLDDIKGQTWRTASFWHRQLLAPRIPEKRGCNSDQQPLGRRNLRQTEERRNPRADGQYRQRHRH